MPRRAAPALLVLSALGTACSGGRASERPSILLILADDLAAGALGFEGSPDARTPNLDRLAREGTWFRRAYVPTPQCAPSRAALLLGLYPHQSGALSNRSAWDERRTTLAQTLDAAGYRCGFVGKWHLGQDEEPQAGFEGSWCAIDRKHLSYSDPLLWIDGKSERREGYVPTLLTDEALRFLEREPGRPFFLWLAYTTPHEPLTPPPDPALAHDPAALTLPASLADDLATKPALQRTSDEHRMFLEQGIEGVRRVSATYQSMVDALDREIGRLLAHLDQSGLARHTLVVFLSDNGTLRGEHQMVTKGPAFYEELVRTPLVLSWPGVVPAAESGALVSTLDLFPTLARLAAAAAPADLAGLDLWPLVTGERAKLRDELYLAYARKRPDAPPTPMLGWVGERHKYVRYLDGGEEELYDLGADPTEQRNLAAAPRHEELLEEARARLEPFRAQAEAALR